MNEITSYKTKNGIYVYYISADRFKTVNFTINITTPLKRPDVTFNALIPAVLKRGCKAYTETKELNTYLDSLYGANISYCVKKRGDYQVIVLNFNTIADRYAPDISPFNKLLELSGEILFNPLIENNGFREEYTIREKENLRQYIEGIINDKREYAKFRLVENMYKDENYGIFSNGYVEELDLISPENLLKHYYKLLNEARIEIFITGPVNQSYCNNFIEKTFTVNKTSFSYTPTLFGEYKDKVNYINESSDVTQGKLSIGMRTNITAESELYYAMMVMNNLYGGSVHSKLFLNVREKLSLAYYAGSAYDSSKGLVLVNSGIEFKNYDIALKEILNQLEDVKNGNFTDDDIKFSKLAIANSFNSAKDSALAMENFYSSQTLRGKFNSIEEFTASINMVTREDIIRAAKTVKTDTVFFLKGSEIK